MRRAPIVATAAIVVAVVGWPAAFTVVPIDQGGPPADGFDAETYVDGVWDEITTTITGEAVDLGEILAVIPRGADGRVRKEDLIPVTERFGLITAGEAHVYKVRINGTVLAVDTATSVGVIEVAVGPSDGPVVQVYVGPRIPSDESSVRDAVGFIQFGDFRDQTEYGKVASEINGRVSAMLADLDAAALQGTTVTVIGALTIRTFNLVEIDLGEIHVVPVAIEQP